ncbi:GIP [Symbiodinium sp. CCMP2592]|nr:GIP [Symbiodinium sp. CCMP2592]
MASHVVRAFQSWACGNGFSLGIIFLDLREAFYRIMRPLVVGFQGSDADIAAIVKEVHLPPEVMHEIHEYLQSETLFESAGASSWLSAATCEALSHTWFRFEHHEAVTETGIGTRPGDNLADIVFSFVFARVLHQVRTAVEQEVGIATLPWHSDMLANPWPVSSTATDSLAILDSTWMDDTALVLYTTVASELPHKIKRALGILLDSCLGRALLPNLDRGKTETIVSLTGTGSRKLRAELFRDDPPLISADSRLWPGATVQIVPHYRHLGGLIHHSGALLRELRCRVAMAWQAFNKRRKRIFSSRFVPVADKVSLFDSLVLSTLLFGAGTWPKLTQAEEQCLSTAYFQMACTLLKPEFDSLQARRIGQLRVLALTGLPTISTLLHLARLRHLAACATNPIPELWALLHAEANWLASACHSLEWLCELVAEESWAPSAPEAWRLWMDTIRCNPGRWKRLLRKAQQRAVRREAWHSAGVYHRGLLSRQLRIAGGILLEPVMELWDRRECCGPCRQTFPNLQAWSVHAFKTHGRLTTGRGEDQHRVQAPVLQAEGPVLPFDSAEWCDEADRADSSRLRQCLRASSALTHYCSSLPGDSTVGLPEPIRPIVARTLEWVPTADVVEWLVPSPDPSMDPTCTFRDEALVLEALEVAAIRLPRALTFSEDPTTVLVGPDEWCLPFDDCRRILFPFSECVASLRRGDPLSFLEGPFEDVVFEICLNDWNGFRQCPPVCLPPASFHRQLLLMTLQGDLMRFALRLWGRGIPTRLLFPVSSRPHISLLLEIPGLDFVESSGWCTLSNCT